MSRVQLALNVDDLDEAVTFYSKLVDIGQGPALGWFDQPPQPHAGPEDEPIRWLKVQRHLGI